MLKTICACLILLLLTTACARKTMMYSEPAGARLSVDGQDVCTTPCSYDYKTGSSDEAYQVVLEKEGFDPIQYQVKADVVDREARSTLWTAGLMIPGGSILWIGSLFTNKLKESYRFVMREETPIVALHTQDVGE
mgnify:CR=1 FL=1